MYHPIPITQVVPPSLVSVLRVGCRRVGADVLPLSMEATGQPRLPPGGLGPAVRLVVVPHATQGVVANLGDFLPRVRTAAPHAIVLVDASETAGLLPLGEAALLADLVVIMANATLRGPAGAGLLLQPLPARGATPVGGAHELLGAWLAHGGLPPLENAALVVAMAAAVHSGAVCFFVLGEKGMLCIRFDLACYVVVKIHNLTLVSPSTDHSAGKDAGGSVPRCRLGPIRPGEASSAPGCALEPRHWAQCSLVSIVKCTRL